MPEKKDQNLNKIIDDQIKYIYDRYEGKSKTFHKLLTGLITFALLFFVLIFFPYISIQYERQRLDTQADLQKEKISQKTPVIKAFELSIKGMEKLRNEIHNGPDNLRSFILELESKPENTARQSQQQFQHQQQSQQAPEYYQMDTGQGIPDAGFLPPQDIKEQMTQKIQGRVEMQINTYGQILEEEVLKPLQGLGENAEGMVDKASVKAGIESLRTGFKQKVAKDPYFWRTYEGKQGLQAEIDGDVEQFWNKLDIEKEKNKLEIQLKNLAAEKARIEAKYDELKKKEGGVIARIEKIESPLGRLPVGLIEAVFIFPVLLSVGFLLCVFSFCDLLKQRRTFQRFYQSKDPNKEILTDAHISYIAPVWLEPSDSARNQKIKFIIFMIPFFIFFITVGLIFFGWRMWGMGSEISVSEKWFYGGLYLLSLIPFVYGGWRIKGDLRHYYDTVGPGSI